MYDFGHIEEFSYLEVENTRMPLNMMTVYMTKHVSDEQAPVEWNDEQLLVLLKYYVKDIFPEYK